MVLNNAQKAYIQAIRDNPDINYGLPFMEYADLLETAYWLMNYACDGESESFGTTIELDLEHLLTLVEAGDEDIVEPIRTFGFKINDRVYEINEATEEKAKVRLFDEAFELESLGELIK